MNKSLSQDPLEHRSSHAKAAGYTDSDLSKPLVGVVNSWAEVTPCNMHLRELAKSVKAGIRAAGGTPIEFNTIVVSDGITMGTAGMRGSLISREVIADSAELVIDSHELDAVVALCGCDKTIPWHGDGPCPTGLALCGTVRWLNLARTTSWKRCQYPRCL